MGNQQLLLITLTTILVGIAVAVGISMVKDYDFDSVGDEIHQHVIAIGNDAYAFSMKPTSMGGGSGQINTYTLQNQMKETPNASYSAARTQKNSIGIIAVSKRPEYQGKLVMVLGFDPAPGYNNSQLKISFLGTARFRKFTKSAQPYIQ